MIGRLIALRSHTVVVAASGYAPITDDQLSLPPWLEFRNLEDLEANLISVIVAVLAVMFLRQAIASCSDEPFVTLSVAIALVIAVLTYFLHRCVPTRD